MSLRDEVPERDINNNKIDHPNIHCNQAQHDEIGRLTAEFLAKKGVIEVVGNSATIVPEGKNAEENKKMRELDKKRFAHKMEHAKAKRQLEKTLPYSR